MADDFPVDPEHRVHIDRDRHNLSHVIIRGTVADVCGWELPAAFVKAVLDER